MECQGWHFSFLKVQSEMKLMEAAERLGSEIFKSQMLGCKNQHQANVIAISCLATGRDVLSFSQDFHLMASKSGAKLSLQASAMLARLSKAGGTYEIVEHSPECAAITVEYKGRRFEERLAWEDARKEPFVYYGKPSEITPKIAAEKWDELELSQNYATPRRRMQHLWARVVSDSVRVVAPDLVSGTYTPEEVADYSGMVTPEINDPRKGTLGRIAPSQDDWNKGDSAAASVAAATSAPPVEEGSGGLPAELVSEIEQLFKRLGIDAQKQHVILAKRSAETVAHLSVEQANEIIDNLRKKLPDQPKDAESTRAPSGGLITAELEQEIRSKIKTVAQQSGKGKEFADSILNKLRSHGMKLCDMQREDAMTLSSSLDSMEIEQFFELDLARHQKKEGETNGGVPF